MAKATGVLLVALLCSMMLVLPAVQGIAFDPKSVEEWFDKLSHKREKLTRLHFYIHNILSGEQPTAVKVVLPKSSGNFDFGLIEMFDDPMTLGPELDSTTIGQLQGSFSSAGIKEMSLVNTFILNFKGGEYHGSTLILLGRNGPYYPFRELSVVGGTGVFRLARGIATVNTYRIDNVTADGTAEYHMNVLHYE
ncbi:dirigent protein 22-like [Diospyros lotus]|uniref:dirigent protein 22-like n=1 Tax=Diospyros lotus TaxID=55363 RepID=UPI00225B1393|nr:dirigent protein 22-like [Diospyros lotus]